jgi:hypothetical protein
MELCVQVTTRLSKCFYDGRACGRSSQCSAPSCGVDTVGRRPEFRAELVLTMFVFWVLNLVSTAGLVLALGWH